MIQNDWIINDNNIFGLQKNISLALCTIQYEIILQLDNKIINSFSSYLKININTTKDIKNTQNLNIDILFKDYLGLDSFNQLKQKEVNCWVCLSYFQILLLKEYNNEKHKNILTFSEYEIQYNSLLESYLNSNIDTDEMDFVKSEQSICNKLLLELNKPVYYKFNISNEVLSTPCLFKVNLSNSIDKRQKFLNDIAYKKRLIINDSNHLKTNNQILKNSAENLNTNNDNAMPIPLKESNIFEYKKGLTPFFSENCLNLMNQDNSQNEYYFGNIIKTYFVNYKKNTIENDNYLNIRNQLNSYILLEDTLYLNIFEVFKLASKHETKKENMLQYEALFNNSIIKLNQHFNKTSAYYLFQVKDLLLNKKYTDALAFKNFIVLSLDKILHVFEEYFCLFIQNTPLAPYLLSLKKYFNNLVNEDQIIKNIEIEKHENLKSVIKKQNDTVNISTSNKTNEVYKYKDFIWFKAGLKLATGEAYDLYNKYKKDKGHFVKITSELGFKATDRPYFSETINDTTISDKNIFSNSDKLEKLYNHIIENDLNLGNKFLTKYNNRELNFPY